jgi:hypothetical protein
MEDTNQNFITRPQPAVLDIKPVEDLEKVVEIRQPEPVDEPELEDLKDDDIFIKPQQETKKKKKVLSERQKAHMKRMGEIRRQKALERKQKDEPKTKVEPKPKKQEPKTEEWVKVEEPNFTGHGGAMGNQEYMKQFFSNMNMFMDTYNKLSEVKQKRPTSNPQPIPEKDNFQDMKPKKQVKPKPKLKNEDCSYSIDFLKTNVGYNYKNPFGF